MRARAKREREMAMKMMKIRLTQNYDSTTTWKCIYIYICGCRGVAHIYIYIYELHHDCHTNCTSYRDGKGGRGRGRETKAWNHPLCISNWWARAEETGPGVVRCLYWSYTTVLALPGWTQVAESLLTFWLQSLWYSDRLQRFYSSGHESWRMNIAICNPAL